MRISRYNDYLNNTQIALQFGSVINRCGFSISYNYYTQILGKSKIIFKIKLNVLHISNGGSYEV